MPTPHRRSFPRRPRSATAVVRAPTARAAARAVGGRRGSRHPVRTALLRARIDIGARTFCLLAGFVVTAFTADAGLAAGTLILLICVAAVMTWWAIMDGPMTKIYLYGLIAEGAFSLTLVLVASPNSDSFIIYVTAPALLAGLRSGIFASFSVVGVQSVVLLAMQAQLRGGGSAFLDLASPWLMTGFAAGLLGAWIRQLRLVERDTIVSPYASAHRLLGQLRTITRELPGGLDIDVGVRGRPRQRDGGARRQPRRAASCATRTARRSWSRARAPTAPSSRPATTRIVSLSMGLQRAMQEPQAAGNAAHRLRMCLPLVVGSAPSARSSSTARRCCPNDVIEDVQTGWTTTRCGSSRPSCSATSGASPPSRSGAAWPARSTTASPRRSPRSATSSTTSRATSATTTTSPAWSASATS